MVEETPIFTQPPGHRCGYWDIPMSKSWRDLDPVITFAEFNEMMLGRVNCGVTGWTLFRLTGFGHEEAHQVYQTGRFTDQMIETIDRSCAEVRIKVSTAAATPVLAHPLKPALPFDH
jgi:hypothetical protein